MFLEVRKRATIRKTAGPWNACPGLHTLHWCKLRRPTHKVLTMLVVCLEFVIVVSYGSIRRVVGAHRRHHRRLVGLSLVHPWGVGIWSLASEDKINVEWLEVMMVILSRKHDMGKGGAMTNNDLFVIAPPLLLDSCWAVLYHQVRTFDRKLPCTSQAFWLAKLPCTTTTPLALGIGRGGDDGWKTRSTRINSSSVSH